MTPSAQHRAIDGPRPALVDPLPADSWIPDQASWSFDGGRTILRGGRDWAWAESGSFDSARLRAIGRFLASVSVRGEAEAAGLSFGPYKDFLAPLRSAHGARLVQVDVDAESGHWGLRVDGTVAQRAWWDAAVRSVDDVLGGVLTLKAKGARDVTFEAAAVRPLASRCRLSVVLTCFRFSRRLQVALSSWCRQTLPSGALEVLVVNPESPDGTHEVVASFATAYPEVHVRELPASRGRARNKGYLINRALEVARGDWIWLSDADCVFPRDAAERALAAAASTRTLYFGERRHLPEQETQALLAGRVDAADEFPSLLAAVEGRPRDAAPWGYCQLFHRSVLAHARYRENVDNFSTSDYQFVDDCRRHGVEPVLAGGLVCLHLSHPFAWFGTDAFL